MSLSSYPSFGYFYKIFDKEGWPHKVTFPLNHQKRRKNTVSISTCCLEIRSKNGMILFYKINSRDVSKVRSHYFNLEKYVTTKNVKLAGTAYEGSLNTILFDNISLDL